MERAITAREEVSWERSATAKGFTHFLSKIICSFALLIDPEPTSIPLFNLSFGCLTTAISAIQGVSVVVPQSSAMLGYTRYEKIIKYVSYLRIDPWANDLGLTEELLYTLMSLFYGSIALLGVCLYAELRWKTPTHHKIGRLVLRIWLTFEQIGVFPVLITTGLNIKKALTGGSLIDQSAFSVLFACLSLCFLPVFLSVLYLTTAVVYTPSFPCRKSHFFAMSAPTLRTASLLIRIFISLSFCFLCDISELGHRILVFALSGVMFALVWAHSPYYSNLTNTVSACEKAVVCWAAFTFTVGSLTDSANTFAALCISVSPLLGYLLHKGLVTHCKRTASIPAGRISRLSQLDLKLRGLMKRTETGNCVVEKVKSVFALSARLFPRRVCTAIWEAEYHFCYENDPAKALLKLTKAQGEASAVESQFVVKRLERKYRNGDSSQERLYLRYLRLFEKAKSLDEICCNICLRFCCELAKPCPNASKVSLLAERMSAYMEKTVSHYFKTLQIYAENTEVLTLLGTFLLDIVKEIEGKTLILRSRDRNKGRFGGSDYNYFAERFGLLVVSSSGTIVSANSASLSILNFVKSDLIGKSAFDVLPSVYRRFAAEIMRQLSDFDVSLELIEKVFATLTDSDGFIIDFEVKVEVTTWENQLFLMVFCRELDHPGVSLLCDEELRIISHGNLQPIIAHTHRNDVLIGMSITQLFPGLQHKLTYSDSELIYEISPKHRFKVTHSQLLFSSATYHHFTFLSVPMQFLSVEQVLSAQLPPKEVRFREALSSILRHSGSTEPPTQSLDGGFNVSDTEAKLKSKLDISASMTSSVVGESRTEATRRRAVNRSAARLKVAIGLTTLSMAAGSIVVFILIRDLMSSLAEVGDVKEFSVRTEEVIRLAYEVRSLDYVENGDFGYVRSAVKENVGQLSGMVGELITVVSEELSKSTEKYRFLRESIPLWRLTEGQESVRMANLFESLYETRSIATQISNSTNSLQSESYFIVQNLPGTLASVLHTTLLNSILEEESVRRQNLAMTELLVYLFCLISCVPTVLFVAPYFSVVEMQFRTVWREIFETGFDLLSEMRLTLSQRLEFHFENDSFQCDAPLCCRKPDDTARPVRLWPGFAAKWLFYPLISLLYCLVLKFGYLGQVDFLAHAIPNYTYWSGMRLSLISQGQFWLRESLVTGSSGSYYERIPTGRQIVSVEDCVQSATQSLKSINEMLMLGGESQRLDDVQWSDSFYKYLFLSGCDSTEDSPCQDSELSLGQVFASGEWVSSTMNIIGSKADSAWGRFEDKTEMLRKAVITALEKFQKEAISRALGVSEEIGILTAGLWAGLAVWYFLVLGPTVGRAKREVMRGIEVRRMIGVRKGEPTRGKA